MEDDDEEGHNGPGLHWFQHRRAPLRVTVTRLGKSDYASANDRDLEAPFVPLELLDSLSPLLPSRVLLHRQHRGPSNEEPWHLIARPWFLEGETFETPLW